nr:atp-dependent rna helicase suv3, mitochondrial [Quercus suber]
MPALASCIAEQKTCNIADLAEMPLEILEAEVSPKRTYLQELERLHKALVTYLWLSYRFAGVFNTRALAFYAKSLTEEKIESALRAFSFSESARKRLAKERQQMQQMLFSDMQNAMAPTPGELEQELETVRADGSIEDPEDKSLRQEESDPVMASAAAVESSEGDHFSAEADDIIFDEPEQAEVDLEDSTAPSASFSQWRAQPGNTFSANDIDTSLAEHVRAGEQAGIAAAIASAELVPGDDPASIVSRDSADGTDPHISPDLDADADLPPNASQKPPPQANSDSSSNLTNDSSTAPDQAYGANVPPKHLAHLDTDATEVERDVVARP